MKPVFVLSDAAEDLELGKAFYESQEIGIGDCQRSVKVYHLRSN
jgi:hypothetical protein